MRKESAIISVCLILLIVPAIYFVATMTYIIGKFLTVPSTSLSIGSDGNLVLEWDGVGGFGLDVIGSPLFLVMTLLSTVAFILLLALLLIIWIRRVNRHSKELENLK